MLDYSYNIFSTAINSRNYAFQTPKERILIIFDISSGNLVAKRANILTGNNLYFSELSAGTYIFKIYTSDLLKSYQFKIVKL